MDGLPYHRHLHKLSSPQQKEQVIRCLCMFHHSCSIAYHDTLTQCLPSFIFYYSFIFSDKIDDLKGFFWKEHVSLPVEYHSMSTS